MTEQSTTPNDFGLPKVKVLEGIADYPHWRRNVRAYISRHDPLLLGLKQGPQGSSAAARTAWERASAQAKGNITLMLSESVQVRAIALCDDHSKTAYDLWQFLESTYTASNEQAVQNIRVKLDSLVYVDGTE